jgi:hypothetical protein
LEKKGVAEPPEVEKKVKGGGRSSHRIDLSL